MKKQYLSKVLTLVLLLLTLTSCNLFQKSLPKEMPDDFSFAITWNIGGMCTYDSKTGILIKHKYATNVDEYTTTCFLTEDELKEIYKLIYDLNIDSCPDEFPYGTFVDADPSSRLSLSVSTKDYSKTVKADSVGAYEAFTIKGTKYLEVIKGIRNILTETEEWKALPDYDYLPD